ncbi:LysR family transcriptional regulator [Pseudomonas putida S11]|nr:LysR family transcriptional regulator [Pseudomonas putida S11]
MQRLQQQARDNVLVLSCEPTIAMRWLIPRLPRFHAAHPDLQLHLVAAGGPLDFARSGVDLAIRRDDFHWDKQLYNQKICDEWIGPVCHPTVPLQLEGQRLLHSATRPDAWPNWLRLSGQQVRHTERSDYQHFYLSIQAASAGLGLAMALSPSWCATNSTMGSCRHRSASCVTARPTTCSAPCRWKTTASASASPRG